MFAAWEIINLMNIFLLADVSISTILKAERFITELLEVASNATQTISCLI